jgi:hypothetical protein
VASETLNDRHTHTHKHTVGLLWTRDRDLYLTTHNTHKRQTSIPLAGFELVMPASERSQTHTIDRVSPGSAFSRLAI